MRTGRAPVTGRSELYRRKKLLIATTIVFDRTGVIEDNSNDPKAIPGSS
jgi:hypothetical protein